MDLSRQVDLCKRRAPQPRALATPDRKDRNLAVAAASKTVQGLLGRLGIQHYAAVFDKHGLDLAALRLLTLADLEGMGVASEDAARIRGVAAAAPRGRRDVARRGAPVGARREAPGATGTQAVAAAVAHLRVVAPASVGDDEIRATLEDARRDPGRVRAALEAWRRREDAPAAAAPSRIQECPCCLERARDTAFVPCGHVLCGACAAAYGEQRCPVCRAAVGTKLKIYL